MGFWEETSLLPFHKTRNLSVTLKGNQLSAPGSKVHHLSSTPGTAVKNPGVLLRGGGLLQKKKKKASSTFGVLHLFSGCRSRVSVKCRCSLRIHRLWQKAFHDPPSPAPSYSVSLLALHLAPGSPEATRQATEKRR